MEPVAWVTVAITAVIILVAAVALLRVIIDLRHISNTLGSVLAGVRLIATQTSAVPTHLPPVNANLTPVRDFAESI